MANALAPTITRPAQAMSELFDQVFGPIYHPFWSGGSSSSLGVLANVYEVGDAYQAYCLVPGIDPESLEVSAFGNTLTIAGTRTVMQPEGGKTVWQEFGQAQFGRQITLPVDVDPNAIQATYANGVLQ